MICLLALAISITGCDGAKQNTAALSSTTVSTPASTTPSITVTTLTPKEADLLEAVFRDRLEGADRTKTLFIAIDSSEGDNQDPPADFLKRLNDLQLRLKPASLARFPKDGEMQSPNRFRGIEDPATGEQCDCCSARILEWVTDTKARVSYSKTSGPLSGGGATLIVELKNGKWTITDTEDMWVG